jgi:hypothetical protein
MKTRSALPTMLLLAVLGGCQELTTPLGPPGQAFASKSGKGGGVGTSPDEPVTLTGAFATQIPQGVQVIADNQLKLELSRTDTFQDTIDLLATIAAGTGTCVSEPANASQARKGALLAKMQDALQNRHFNALIDRTALGSASPDHQVAHTWGDEDGGLYSLRIGEAGMLPGLHATVTRTEVSPGRYEYTFTGGAARMADRTGRVKNHLYLACPNLDTVMLTIAR